MPPNDKPGEDMDALRARMKTLQAHIRAQTPPPGANPASAVNSGGGTSGSEMSKGLRAGTEFIGAIIVGGAIGWGLDWLLHTKPLLTILFFLLGVVAGVFNVIRATMPKGANFVGDSGLSGERADAKDVPRVSPRGGEKQKD